MEADTEEYEDKENVCCLKDILESCKKRESKSLLLLSENRLSSVQKASRKRKDNLNLDSEKEKKSICHFDLVHMWSTERRVKWGNQSSCDQRKLRQTYILLTGGIIWTVISHL